jgi:hypothetical protein
LSLAAVWRASVGPSTKKVGWEMLGLIGGHDLRFLSPRFQSAVSPLSTARRWSSSRLGQDAYDRATADCPIDPMGLGALPGFAAGRTIQNR